MSPFPAEGRGWGGAEGQKAPPEPASLPAEVPAGTRLAGREVRAAAPVAATPTFDSVLRPTLAPTPGPGARSGSSRCLGQGGRKGGGERQVSGSRMRAEWGLLRNPAPGRCVPEAPQDLRALPRSQGAPRAARESLAAGDVGCNPPPPPPPELSGRIRPPPLRASRSRELANVPGIQVGKGAGRGGGAR